jgi:hypothetical protein
MGEKKIMGILENFENAWDIDFQEEPKDPSSLASKIFSETVCEQCLENFGIEQ